jgi:hypothetical protein
VVAKLLAGRPHDIEFCRALVGAGVIDTAVVAQRFADTDMGDDERSRMNRLLELLTSASMHTE